MGDDLNIGKHLTEHAVLGVSAGGIKKGYQLIEEITITSAAQTKDFAETLDGDSDGGYIIEFYLVNGTGGTSTLNLRINEADWAVTRTRLRQTGLSVAGLRDNNINFGSATTSSEATFMIQIPKSSTGNRRHVFVDTVENSSTLIFIDARFDVTTPSAATNITSLGIASDVEDGMGVDSVMRLYKLIK